MWRRSVAPGWSNESKTTPGVFDGLKEAPECRQNGGWKGS